MNSKMKKEETTAPRILFPILIKEKEIKCSTLCPIHLTAITMRIKERESDTDLSVLVETSKYFRIKGSIRRDKRVHRKVAKMKAIKDTAWRIAPVRNPLKAATPVIDRMARSIQFILPFSM
ncbi:hypothetical protein HMPREF1869_01322 [Bacteroidales bacterium KA00251]|nr:hypothetical protein HMPREF1869_01322 [Bacteroidales bacterium KA00251]